MSDHRNKERVMPRQRVGYEVVETDDPGRAFRFSFRVRNTAGQVIPGTDCPRWFATRKEAVHMAEACMKFVTDRLRQMGVAVTRV